MAVQKPGVEQRGMGREKLVLVVWRQDSWCRACVMWDTEGATPVPRRRWYSGWTRSSVCKLTENWEQEERLYTSRHLEIWTAGTPISTSTNHPSSCRPLFHPRPSGRAQQSCSFLTCKQATVPSPKFKVPTTSSPSLYTDLKIPNVPTFPRPSLILYRSGENRYQKVTFTLGNI